MKACITLANQGEITMPNEKLILTTNDGAVIPIIMAPARCGAGVAVIIPQCFTGEQRVQYQALFALKRFELAELKALASK